MGQKMVGRKVMRRVQMSERWTVGCLAGKLVVHWVGKLAVLREGKWVESMVERKAETKVELTVAL